MSKKRFIDTSFWADVWVVDELNRDERYFFMYLLTNDKTSIAGVYELSIKMMAFESDFTRDEILAMFESMKSKINYVKGWVILRNGIKNQNYKNEKIRRGIELVLEQSPAECLEFLDIPKDFHYKPVDKSNQQRLLDDSSMSLDESLHSDSDSEPDSNTDSEPDPDPKARPKPTPRARSKIDQELAARERAARTRKSSSANKHEDIADLFGGKRYGVNPVQ